MLVQLHQWNGYWAYFNFQSITEGTMLLNKVVEEGEYSNRPKEKLDCTRAK